jgi:spermidine/putrescine-binding protein
MKKINANMRFYWTDSTQIEQAMASGELVAATTWNESVLKLQNQGIPVAYMTPKEGILTWVCGLSLLSGGTGDEDQKYDFLNAMLSVESGKQLIEQYNYGHSNRKAMESVDPALLKQLGIDNAEQRLETTRFFDEIPPATRERMNAMLEQVKAGL